MTTTVNEDVTSIGINRMTQKANSREPVSAEPHPIDQESNVIWVYLLRIQRLESNIYHHTRLHEQHNPHGSLAVNTFRGGNCIPHLPSDVSDPRCHILWKRELYICQI